MTYNSQTFPAFEYGSNTSYQNGTYTPSNATFGESFYLVDSNKSATDIHVLDTVTVNLIGSNTSVTGTYLGYVLASDGTEQPLVQEANGSSGSGYYLYITENTYFSNPFGSFKVVQKAYTQGGVVCFRANTLIRTPEGDVAVEHLTVGDLVVNASGVYRPIKWLGHRTIDCRHHLRPHEAMPIRIAAHAFGDSRPARDLFVSPGHAVCVDVLGETLIPAGALVNGSTIRQVEVDSVTYWHVELDSHDVLLAENLPAESYIDMSNRGFFQEPDLVALVAGPDDIAAMAPSCGIVTLQPIHAAARG